MKDSNEDKDFEPEAFVEVLRTLKSKKVPQIQFGEDFHQFDDARKIRYLKRLASAMNHAADLMQRERNTLASEVVLIKEQLVNAEKALMIQKQVVSSQLLAGNEELQALSLQVQDLQRQLKQSRVDRP